jgi:hypothetical protein
MSWRTLLWGAAVLLAMLAAGLLWWRLRPHLTRLRQRLAKRRRALSEGAHAQFAATLQACQAGDAAAASRALGAWTRAAHGTTPAAWTEAVGDAVLARAVTDLQRHLYGSIPAQAAWDGNPLAQALRRHAATAPIRQQRQAVTALPPLNP